MASNSITLESWKVSRTLRLKLESLTNLGHFLFLRPKSINICILIPPSNRFLAYFNEFHMFSKKELLQSLLFLNDLCENAVELACETNEILFHRTAFFSFWKSKRVDWSD